MNTIKMLLAFAVPAFSLLAQEPVEPTAESATRDFIGITADAAQVTKVRHVVLKRDVGTIELTEGTLYFGKQVAHRSCTALFLGRGKFVMTPPTESEKAQLVRLLQNDTVRTEFTSLFLVFTDSTREYLTREVRFVSEEVPDEVADYFKAYTAYFTDKHRQCISSFDDGLLSAILNPGIPYFLAGFSSRSPSSLAGTGMFAQRWKSDPFFFEIDGIGHDREEVRLLRRNPHLDDRFFKEVVSQFERQADSSLPRFMRLKKTDTFRVPRFDIESTFDSKLNLTGKTEMTVFPLLENLKWIPFALHTRLSVDSVFINGRRANFMKPFETSAFHDESFERETLWIQTDSSFQNMRECSIKIYYRGEIITRINNDLFLQSSILWYPNPLQHSVATFQLAFQIPDHFRLVAIGNRISETKKSGTRKSVWKLDVPNRNASFAIGFFKEVSIDDKRIPTVKVYTDEDKTGVYIGSSIENQVLTDIANSYAYFQEWFGPLNTKSISAAEIPSGHGEAFSGFIHLGWWTFTSDEKYGLDEMFRAHEVAHQWWPGPHGYDSYHDRWLGEGLAEYLGLMYMQQSREKNEEFFKFLKNFRERLYKQRQGFSEKLLGEDIALGPVWLGRRNYTSATSGDETLLIYEKGAWIFHMLRMMAIDLNSLNEDAFRTLLKDFFVSNQGRALCTVDFQRTVEKYFGQDMTWFFRQWVYGTALPKYEVRQQATAQRNGKFRVRLKIRQTNVPSDFQMPVPILVDYGSQRSSRFRILVKGPLTEIETPDLPLEPKRVVFNYLESVLCEIKEKSWNE